MLTYVDASMAMAVIGLLCLLVYKFSPESGIAKLPAVPLYRTVLGMLKRLPFDDMLNYTTQMELIHKYKLVRAYFQGQWTVMVGCPKVAAAIYNNTVLFPKLVPGHQHPDSVFAKLTGVSAFFSNGEDWRQQRKTVLGSKAFSLSGNLNKESITTLMDKLDEKINSYEGSKINTLDLMQRVTFDCLSKHFLNKDFGLIHGAENGILHLFDNAFTYGFTLLTFLFPYLQSPKNPFYRKVYNDINQWENCLQQVVRATRKRIEIEGNANCTDLVSKMILSSPGVTDEVVLSNLKMLFLPSQSLPPALCASLHYLAQNPSIQRKAYVEIKNTLGNFSEALTDEQLLSMPYLTSIIKETLRLYPTLCPPPKRVASQDTTVCGTFIPKGTHLMIDMFAIQRDPSLWSSPEEFDPTRFLTDDKLNIPHSALASGYMPFGSGSRRCPGSNIVNNLMANILAKVITKYHVSYPAKSYVENSSIHFKLKLKAQVILIPDNLELEFLPHNV